MRLLSKFTSKLKQAPEDTVEAAAAPEEEEGSDLSWFVC